jgi:hypothetical protein
MSFMHTWKFRRKNRRWAAVWLFLVSMPQICGASGEPACRFYEITYKKMQNSVAYEDTRLPWSVTSVDLSGAVTVKDRRSGATCRIETDTDARPRVYANRSSIALRTIEVSSDDIFFYDAATCRTLRKPEPAHLGMFPSIEERDRKVRSLGLCSHWGARRK